MAPPLPKGIRFVRGPGFKKYTAILPDGKRVNFGDRRYQQYKDIVPPKLGGGKWSHKDHRDHKRRAAYRKRHAGMTCKNGSKCIDKKFSPAWFSYYFLW